MRSELCVDLAGASVFASFHIIHPVGTSYDYLRALGERFRCNPDSSSTENFKSALSFVGKSRQYIPSTRNSDV